MKEKQSFWKRFSWLGVALIWILTKLKSLLPLLKFSKFGGTLISMGISIAAYAYLYTWWFAIGLVVMIFIHEMGHVWAAKRKKLPVSAPAFIPFVGALIMMKKLPQDAKTEAYIAYGGPLLGTIGALACFALAAYTDMQVLYVIALIGFFLNLFNLIPISPLDGGRIVGAISRWFWVLGVILALILVVVMKSILLLIIVGLFAFEMWAKRRSNRREPVEMTHRFRVLKERFDIIPGEKHQRQLAIMHYCEVQNRAEWVAIAYPGAGVIGQLDMAQHSGTVGQVQLVQTVSVNDTELDMYVKAIHLPDPDQQDKQDRYYQVTPWTRVKYAAAYFGLAIFLTVMTFITYTRIDQISL